MIQQWPMLSKPFIASQQFLFMKEKRYGSGMLKTVSISSNACGAESVFSSYILRNNHDLQDFFPRNVYFTFQFKQAHNSHMGVPGLLENCIVNYCSYGSLFIRTGQTECCRKPFNNLKTSILRAYIA